MCKDKTNWLFTAAVLCWFLALGLFVWSGTITAGTAGAILLAFAIGGLAGHFAATVYSEAVLKKDPRLLIGQGGWEWVAMGVAVFVGGVAGGAIAWGMRIMFNPKIDPVEVAVSGMTDYDNGMLIGGALAGGVCAVMFWYWGNAGQDEH